MCLSGLEMGVNTVCTLEVDGKHDLLTIFSSRGQKQNAAKYGTREGTFLFQYLPEKKSKQKELERQSKQ